jgi:predicted ATP-grasp superfamily ATP-dependent carboligase
LIVGASARAAAFSALRAGYEPICCDQFADADLQAVARCCRVDRFPDELVECARQFPELPLLYTGGLENHPATIARLAAGRLLLGNGPDAVRQVRDPLGVAQALRGVRLPCLEVRPAGDPPPADGAWLLKPLHSAGGLGILPWTAAAAHAPTLQRPHYFQQRADGGAYSAVFLARESIGDVRFVGVTEQLVGEEFCNGSGFAWCGNIGPVALPVRIESTIRRLANFLKWKFHLRGLFGLDFVVTPDGAVGLTEVNPRYPASVELLEFATGVCLLLDHCACFEGGPCETPEVDWEPLPHRVLGKAILYSRSKVTVRFEQAFPPDGYRTWPRYLDVPTPESVIPPGAPICTVAATGATPAECREQLQNEARRLLAAVG